MWIITYSIRINTFRGKNWNEWEEKHEIIKSRLELELRYKKLKGLADFCNIKTFSCNEIKIDNEN